MDLSIKQTNLFKEMQIPKSQDERKTGPIAAKYSFARPGSHYL